jgi:hypothetical protein
MRMWKYLPFLFLYKQAPLRARILIKQHFERTMYMADLK